MMKFLVCYHFVSVARIERHMLGVEQWMHGVQMQNEQAAAAAAVDRHRSSGSSIQVFHALYVHSMLS